MIEAAGGDRPTENLSPGPAAGFGFVFRPRTCCLERGRALHITAGTMVLVPRLFPKSNHGHSLEWLCARERGPLTYKGCRTQGTRTLTLKSCCGPLLEWRPTGSINKWGPGQCPVTLGPQGSRTHPVVVFMVSEFIIGVEIFDS